MGTFKDAEHESFFDRMQETTGKTDSAHRALFYMLGVNKETRDHYPRIYDEKKKTIRRSCLEEEWQNDASREICLVAMSLFKGKTEIDLSMSSSPEDEPFAKNALVIRKMNVAQLFKRTVITGIFVIFVAYLIGFIIGWQDAMIENTQLLIDHLNNLMFKVATPGLVILLIAEMVILLRCPKEA